MNEPPSPESSPYWRESEQLDAPENGVPTDGPPRAPADEAAPDAPRTPVGDPPPEPRRPARAVTVVAVVSGVIGLAATVVAVMLTDPQQSIGTASAAVPVIAVVATLTAAVIGTVLLERRRGRRPLATLVVVVSTVGFVVSAATFLPLPDLGVHAYGYACPYYVTSVRDSTGVTPDEPLPYGSSIAVAAAIQQKAWTTFTVSQPINVTADARKAGQRPPRSGGYYAVPVTRGIADDAVMTCDDPLKELTYWVTSSGAEIKATPLSVPDYPGGAQGGQHNDDGSVTYYVVFDIASATARSGTFSLSPLTDGDSPEQVFWGINPGAEVTSAPPVVPGEASASPSDIPEVSPSPSNLPDASDISPTDVYVADPSGPGFSPDDPHPFGAGQTLQSVTTREDALRFVVSAPVDISKIAHAAGVKDPHGSYIAVPVTSTEIDPDVISDASGTYYPADSWLTPDNDMIDPVEIKVPGYPTWYEVDQPNPDGTWSYFEIFDVPSDSIDSGQYAVWLSHPNGSGPDTVFWGAPRK